MIQLFMIHDSTFRGLGRGNHTQSPHYAIVFIIAYTVIMLQRPKRSKLECRIPNTMRISTPKYESIPLLHLCSNYD